MDLHSTISHFTTFGAVKQEEGKSVTFFQSKHLWVSHIFHGFEVFFLKIII